MQYCAHDGRNPHQYLTSEMLGFLEPLFQILFEPSVTLHESISIDIAFFQGSSWFSNSFFTACNTDEATTTKCDCSLRYEARTVKTRVWLLFVASSRFRENFVVFNLLKSWSLIVLQRPKAILYDAVVWCICSVSKAGLSLDSSFAKSNFPSIE